MQILKTILQFCNPHTQGKESSGINKAINNMKKSNTETLDLSNNQIRDIDIKNIASALTLNKEIDLFKLLNDPIMAINCFDGIKKLDIKHYASINLLDIKFISTMENFDNEIQLLLINCGIVINNSKLTQNELIKIKHFL